MYDLGDVVALQVKVTDADGAAAAAGAVTCTVTLPDGTTETPDVTTTTTGTYDVTYTPTVVGHFDVRWVATGANAAAFTDAFNVSTAGSQLLSLAEAKAALNFTTSDNDAELRYYLAAATDLVEAHVGPILHRPVTEQLWARGGVIRLATVPVVSLTTVEASMTGGLTYDAADLIVSTDGMVRAANRTPIITDLYDVTYVTGRSGAVPPRLLQATRLLVGHLWETQRGSYSPGWNRSGETFTPTYTMPNRVLELLQWDLHGPLVG